MAYLKSEDYKIIKELSDKGDKKAKEFLFDLTNLSQDKVNEFLSTISIGKPKNELESAINFLINDELEAIDGYDKAIKLVASDNSDESKHKIDVFNKIKNEEIEHIKMLKELVGE